MVNYLHIRLTCSVAAAAVSRPIRVCFSFLQVVEAGIRAGIFTRVTNIGDSFHFRLNRIARNIQSSLQKASANTEKKKNSTDWKWDFFQLGKRQTKHREIKCEMQKINKLFVEQLWKWENEKHKDQLR